MIYVAIYDYSVVKKNSAPQINRNVCNNEHWRVHRLFLSICIRHWEIETTRDIAGEQLTKHDLFNFSYMY